MKKDRVKDDLHDLRVELLDIVKDVVPLIRETIEGKRRMNHQQVMLTKLVMSKVIPDVTINAVPIRQENSEVELLSREQLETLVAQSLGSVRAISDSSTIDGQAIDLTQNSSDGCQESVSLNELPVPFMQLELRRKGRIAKGGGASVDPAVGVPSESDP